jgi:hypothetical protein
MGIIFVQRKLNLRLEKGFRKRFKIHHFPENGHQINLQK